MDNSTSTLRSSLWILSYQGYCCGIQDILSYFFDQIHINQKRYNYFMPLPSTSLNGRGCDNGGNYVVMSSKSKMITLILIRVWHFYCLRKTVIRWKITFETNYEDFLGLFKPTLTRLVGVRLTRRCWDYVSEWHDPDSWNCGLNGVLGDFELVVQH